MYCDWLARREMLTPDKVALVCRTAGQRTEITYRQLNRNANRTARWLEGRLGVGRGDRVAILAKNSAAYLELWFACGKIGAILQTLNWRLTGSELGALLEAAPPKVLVYSAGTYAQVSPLREPGARRAERFASLDAAEGDDAALREREALSDAPFVASAHVRAEDPWVICYTGGSTGVPKGAVLTHGSVMANAVNTVASWGLTESDVAILNAPLFHVGGLNVLTTPLVLVGGTSIVCEAFDAGEVFDLVATEGVTAFFGVPTMFLSLLQHPAWEKSDFSRLKLVISGGAPCPEPILEAFWARGVGIKTGYGLTEAGPNNFWLPASMVKAKPGSVGYPLFLVETRVMAGDQECQGEETGELWLRGPHVFAGYWGRPEETAHAITTEGWLKTGDLVRRDAEGCFSIVGRVKDLLISGGENVYPAEVEGVLAAHPAVAEAALIGVPDPKWGEVGRALVVAKPGASLEPEALLAFCREHLARYKVPKDVQILNALPRTAAGKVDKPALRRSYG